MNASAVAARLGCLLLVVVAATRPVAAQTAPRYRYVEPPALGDGLATGALGAAQLDATPIVAGTGAILAGTVSRGPLPALYLDHIVPAVRG